MPGLTNRRRAIQEGTDWTKPNSKAKGYKYGGMIVGGGSGRIPGVSESISRATKSTSKRKSPIRGYKSGGKVKSRRP
jgi:hypothetical protein